MPIEIRELVIRAAVNPGETAGGCGKSSSSAAAQSSSHTQTDSGDDLVQTCVREVLRILDDKRER
jgi:uncharacterized protein DUF5908